MNKTFNIDKKRYRELSGGNPWKEPATLVIYIFRKLQAAEKLFKPLRIIAFLFLIPTYRFVSVFHGISLPRRTKVGSGLVIFHYGAIAVNELVVIGNNCTLRHGVTIGNKVALDDVPIIGDNVNIGAGAAIIGKIKIGKNVSIGANAVVLKDVPDNHIAVGNPARILPKK